MLSDIKKIHSILKSQQKKNQKRYICKTTFDPYETRLRLHKWNHTASVTISCSDVVYFLRKVIDTYLKIKEKL